MKSFAVAGNPGGVSRHECYTSGVFRARQDLAAMRAQHTILLHTLRIMPVL